jgi:pantoate--beta-alanine ligase
MDIFKTTGEMHGWSARQGREGKTIAFVPTMGALHQGHLSLLREGRRRADRLILSIYVNPTQFGPTEDLGSYPRDLDGDLKKAREEGVDAVFLPTDQVMYAENYRTYVTVEDLAQSLCGQRRPTHFRGVATVVIKLFNIVTPDVAIFGEKDFQQLVLIRQMTRDLNLPVEIVGCPIVREKDGLAMSSRNAYLSPKEREAARSLLRSLNVAQALVDNGQTDSGTIIKEVQTTIESTKLARIDYVKLVDPDTLKDLAKFKAPALLAIAAFVGRARLIDNILFS